MSPADHLDIDPKSPPFDRLRGIRVLATSRSGRDSSAHARHQLYTGRDKATSAQVLVKVTSRPGVFYERNLLTEIENLRTINEALPDSKVFPVALDHGRLRDGRLYLTTYLFDELPLASTIGPDRVPSKTSQHVRTAIAVARALDELHRIPLFHVDLNPMNILFRTEHGAPVIRIVDFESSFSPARHADGAFYDPPTTPGYSAPEVSQQPPDARADVYSLGAVLYTLLAGFGWTWESDVHTCVKADHALDADLRALLLKAVALKPSARHASMATFRNALLAYADAHWPGQGGSW